MYPLIAGSYSTYSLFLPAMALLGIAAFVYYLRNEGQQPLAIFKLLLALAIPMTLGPKLFSLATRGWPSDISLAQELVSGWRFSGSVIGLLLIPLLGRYIMPTVTTGRMFDILAICLVISMCFGRVACILAGCCTGAIGEGFFHLAYPPGSAVWYHHLHAGIIESSTSWSKPVFALPLLLLPASLLAASLMLWLDKRRHFDGQVFLLFLAVHELPKAGLELLRSPFITEQFYAALILGVLGTCLLAYNWLTGKRSVTCFAKQVNNR